MKNSQERICRACFGVLLAVGVGLLFLGLIVVPLLPHFQLDVVLTPEELLDPHKREAATDLLKKAAGNQWLFWTASGLVIIVASGIGLWASLKMRCGEKDKAHVNDEL